MKTGLYYIGIEKQYKSFGRGMNNRTRTLTTPNAPMTLLNMANRSHLFSHCMPEIFNTCNGNGDFTNHTYLATQNRGCTHNTIQFRQINTLQGQQGFYCRGSPWSYGSLYGTFPCEHYNHGLHNPNITSNFPEAIPFGQARNTIYEGNLLLSIMIEQTIIQVAFSSIETHDGTKG